MVKRKNFVVAYKHRSSVGLSGGIYCKACSTTHITPHHAHCPCDCNHTCITTGDEHTFNNKEHEIVATIHECRVKTIGLCHRECDSCMVNVIITTQAYMEGV